MKLTRLVVPLACTLAANLSAQDGRKVAAPLPPVDLDHKVWTPAPFAPPTPAKVDRPAPAPERTHAAPAKRPDNVVLPSGKSFAPRMPTAPVFGGDSHAIDVLGSTYKARLADGVFSYVPYFGADTPRNFPIDVRLVRVDMGSAATPVRAPSVRRDGERITLQHGACDEIYEVALDHVEQKFLIDERFQGDLCITLLVDTELRAQRTADGWQFGNEFGAVNYTDAVLIDAHGNRLPMQTAFAGGTLTLRAAASVIAQAAFPIVVDPVFTTFTSTGSTTYLLVEPDIAYSHTARSHLVVWTRRYSATDYDLHAVAVDDSGTVVANSFTLLDNTSDRWLQGKVAVCGTNYLAVATRTPAAGGQSEIWGITRDVGSSNTGGQFQISDNSGDKVAPDVGGEFWGPTNFCVVWQRNFSASDRDIHYRMVAQNGTLNGATGMIDNSSANYDLLPTIAKCDGEGPASAQFWPVTWQRQVNGQYDIIGARVRWDGQLATPPFIIDNAVPDDDTTPCPSSLTGNIGGVRYWMVAYASYLNTNWDIYVRVFVDGTAPILRSGNYLGSIEGLSNTVRSRHQWAPIVDTDGCRFVISYLEDYSASDYDAYLTTVHVASSLAAIEARAPLSTSTLTTYSTALSAKRSGGGDSLDFIAAYDLNSTTSVINSSIAGAVYQGVRSTGGFATRNMACGGMSISYANGSQIPGPGRTVQVDVSGGIGNQLIVFGLPTDLALCPSSTCRLGVTTMVILPSSTLAFTIPCQASVVGATVSVQGVGIVGGGGCPNLGQVATTDALDITVR